VIVIDQLDHETMAAETRDSMVGLATENHNTARFHVVVIVSKRSCLTVSSAVPSSVFHCDKQRMEQLAQSMNRD
jgi:hypothetical protein